MPSGPPLLSDAVLQTLTMVADGLTATQDSWWLIGGAAVGLHGVRAAAIPDVDVILSPRDAARVLSGLNIPQGQDGGTALFRSEVFGRWVEPPLPVEFMGGFQIRTQEGWRPLEPATRQSFLVGGRMLYAPSRPELIEICRLFGRPKDLDRAEALSRLE